MGTLTYKGTNGNDYGKASRTNPWWRTAYWEHWKMYGYDGNDTLIGGEIADTLDGGGWG